MVRSNSELMKIAKQFMVALDENMVERLADVRQAMKGTAFAALYLVFLSPRWPWCCIL